MAVRANKLLSELNIGVATLESMLNTLGFKENYFTPNTKIPDDLVILVKAFGSRDNDLRRLVEIASENGVYGKQKELPSTLKIVGQIDLDAINATDGKRISRHQLKDNQHETLTDIPTLVYSKKQNFWISELVLLSLKGEVNGINVGTFEEANKQPLFSVLIGTNGAGKSMLMKEIVDFFLDLHACINGTEQRISSANKGRLKGISYHIDGSDCEVIRLEKNYFVRIDGYFRSLKELRIPAIVACHFGAFDKLPIQKVNGSAQTKYDVPYYKYVGAHVNGSMISSSAIAFRLLFALSEQMDDEQRKNICSILDFIGYDHRVSLSYTMVMKDKKDGAVKETIAQRVDKDREYNRLDKKEKTAKANQLYNFYKTKTASGKAQHDYDLDFDGATTGNTIDELSYIYKLKQYDLVSNSTNVIFHKRGINITSEEMSSGEFDMLATVLSISAAADYPHTLILLDEPELSLHPNWQMTLIDNLDRALKNKVCHFLIATHSHMLVSDLPMKRSSVIQTEKDENSNLKATTISESTYGWSAEEVLLKVFKTATDRNRYFGERIGKLLEQMGNATIPPENVTKELKDLQEISMHLSDIDPMKTILNTIVETYK